jgi:rubrerythrin
MLAERQPSFSLTIETDRYLAVSSKVDTSDIDWSLAKQHFLSDDEIFILNYFSDIEHQTIVYFRDLLKTKAALESDVIAFLTMWNYEEFFHGKELGRLLIESGHSPDKERISNVRKKTSLSEKLEAGAASVLSAVFYNEFPALYTAWGAVQEITTLRAYEELGRLTENPILKILCERIAKQERRHFAWYFNTAKDRLSASKKAQWLTKNLLNYFWSPVGAGVKTKPEVARIISLLFPGDIAVKVGEEIDSKIRTLPGLAGVNLMSRYMRESVETYRKCVVN